MPSYTLQLEDIIAQKRFYVSRIFVQPFRVALVSDVLFTALLIQTVNRILGDKCLVIGWFSTVIGCFMSLSTTHLAFTPSPSPQLRLAVLSLRSHFAKLVAL